MRRFWRYYFIRIILILVVIELGFFAWLQIRNHRPVASEDSTSVFQRHSVRINLLQNDTDKDEDEIKLAEVGKPLNGGLEIENDRYIIYTPQPDFTGTDSFTYIIKDPKKESKPAFIKIEVKENMAPVANRDEFTIFPWDNTTLSVLENDEDQENDTIFISSFTEAAAGSVEQQGNSLIYAVTKLNARIDSFYYTLSDGFNTSPKTLVVIELKDVKNSIFSPVPYYGDLKNYEIRNPSRWDIIYENVNPCIAINTSQYDGLSGSRTGAYCILKNRWFGNAFKISTKVKSTDNLESNSAADYAVYFGYVDEMNYCYASFSSHEEGDGFTGLFKIINGERQTVIYKGRAFTDNKYHLVELVKRGTEVIISINGKELCRATDEDFDKEGRIGIGSYNDMANFDDIRVTGSYIFK